MSAQATFNDLMREAYNAQETFDNWDQGVTYVSIGHKLVRRECTLDEVVAELDAANAALVAHVRSHGEELDFAFKGLKVGDMVVATEEEAP